MKQDWLALAQLSNAFFLNILENNKKSLCRRRSLKNCITLLTLRGSSETNTESDSGPYHHAASEYTVTVYDEDNAFFQ